MILSARGYPMTASLSAFIRKLPVRIWGAALLFSLIIPGLTAGDRRLEISVPQAAVHLQPDLRSSVIATLTQGEILTLASNRKFKREWNYVYFSSRSSGSLKSGYVRDADVKKLYVNTRSMSFTGSSETRAARPVSSGEAQTVSWGMPVRDLIRLMGDPRRVESNDGFRILRYERRVLDRACRIDYMFSGDGLQRTRYMFLEEYVEKSRYIEEYQRLVQQFTGKYGNPVHENSLWHDPVLRDDPPRWGQAVSLGHVSFQSLWRVDQTEIALSLSGTDQRVILELVYSSFGRP
jgi:hypothetical protein